MKLKLTALIVCLLFSIGIITSCSGNTEKENSSASESKTSSVVDNDDDEDDFDWEDALETVVDYIADKEGVDDDEIDSKLNYKILPDKSGESYFVRYSAEGISSDDALVFKDGKKYILSVDGKSKFVQYKSNFAVDISNITDDELLKQKDCINGGFGAEFDV